MNPASSKAGRFNKLVALSVLLVTGCSSAPAGLGLGAGAAAAGNLDLVVDSLAQPVDLALLPELADREAQPIAIETAGSQESSLAVGLEGDQAYADPARSRSLMSIGLSLLQSLDLQARTAMDASASANAYANAGGSGSVGGESSAGCSSSATAAASMRAGAGADSSAGGSSNAHGSAEANLEGWVFQRIDFKPTRIEVHLSHSASGSASGWISVPVNGEAAIDLVKINEQGSSQVMAAAILEAGTYDRIRFFGADTRNSMETAANTYLALDTQGKAHTGVYKLPGQVLTAEAGFEVKADSATELTFSIDPRTALHRAGSRLILQPSSLVVEARTKAAAQATAQATASGSAN